MQINEISKYDEDWFVVDPSNGNPLNYGGMYLAASSLSEITQFAYTIPYDDCGLDPYMVYLQGKDVLPYLPETELIPTKGVINVDGLKVITKADGNLDLVPRGASF